MTKSRNLVHFCSNFPCNREINTREIRLPYFREIKVRPKISKNKVRIPGLAPAQIPGYTCRKFFTF